ANSGMDGFTVLPDGSFIGNLGDAFNSYTHWDAAGNQVGPVFSVPGCSSSTGVDVAPDGLSLYFACNLSSIVQTDLTGLNVLASIPGIGPGAGSYEDLAIQQQFVCVGQQCVPVNGGVPAPATLIMLGVGLLGVGVLRRRAGAN
ncbi:MAG TPA: PEP-CTERM sorting domain-containing protein, partial [Methylomirabilota bacterium]|nr:PEP-CTERM sorting domain-containing protein [Methylomirabilota bacterium]